MDIYDELGVRKIINGYATLTSLGGSLMPLEVLDAMTEAARHFVNIDELQDRAGKRIAEWTHNEAAYISCGAAAGLALSTAACITGLDPEKRERLPFTDGMKNEVIVHLCSGEEYNFTIRQAGGRVVQIGTQDYATTADLEAAISQQTAAILVYYKETRMQGQLPLERQIEIARRHGIPMIVDAAAQLPPVENLWRFTQLGADLVVFSGGKGLCGPQSSGLILGRRDLIEACAFNASPRTYIGRPMKVGKEEIAGLIAAVRRYLDLDHAELTHTYEEQVAFILAAFAGEAHVRARRGFPSEAGQPIPRAELFLDEQGVGISRDAILNRLFEGNPAVSLAPAGENGLYINPQTLQPGEEKIVVERIKEILNKELTTKAQR
ncbi:MAG: aminotransferase class V-fold PLP-dependent enzyme [Chloroflexi bacterium]|nr:aminotransferase class V-fold PLP-dependent enzyme [Chloroflexota bacterium]